MANEDLMTFSSIGKHIQHGIAGYPYNISSTSNEVIFYACNNGSTYHFKDKGIDTIGDYVHYLDITQNTGEDGAIAFPWLISNDLGNAKNLKDASKNFIAIKFQTSFGVHNICIEECYNGTLYDSLPPFVNTLNQQIFLKIINLGNYIGVMIYNSANDRETNMNVQAILSLILHQVYSFRYIFLGNTWFTNPDDSKMIKMTLNNFESDRPIVILDDDFPSQAGWETYATSGVPKIQFISSQVRFYPASGTVTGIASGLTHLPIFAPYPLLSKTTIEFKFKVINSFNMCSFMLRTNASNKYVGFTVASTKIQLDNISYNLSHSLNTWYTYRLIIDTGGNSCKVYRKIENGSFSFIKNFTPLITSSGNFFDLSFFAVISGSEAYLEYVKILPGTIVP